jgi:glycosyltransferase involved in cell wall biosynthesis
MRILHVWDQAGVACILAKYQRLQGHDAKVIMNRGQDKYGIYKFYEKYISDFRLEDFTEKCLEEAELADIIHIHSRIDILFKLRRKFGRSKKIVLHYHGTDIRGPYRPENHVPMRLRLSNIVLKSRAMAKTSRRKRFHIGAQLLADIVIVSTPDLLSIVSDAIYVPNPVDTDHFKPQVIYEKKKRALTLKTEVNNAQWALDYCKNNNIRLDIEIYDRSLGPIMHADMPNFLGQYSVYVDIRYVNETILQGLSKTALEALGCGVKVLDYQLKYQFGLPIEHDPVNVVSRISSIYSDKRSLSINLWYFIYFLSLVEVNLWDFLVLIRKSFSKSLNKPYKSIK